MFSLLILFTTFASARDIAVGTNTVCIIDLNNRAVCSGLGVYQSVQTPLQCTDVSVTDTTACFVCENKLWCTGADVFGSVGRPPNTYEQATLVLDNVVSTCASNDYRCVRTTSNQLKCAGRNNAGVFGTVVAEYAYLTSFVTMATSVSSEYECAPNHICYVSLTGQLFCRGSDNQGQLGRGSTSNTAVTSWHLAANDVKLIGLGFARTCFVLLAGGVRCAGFSQHGALGNGIITALVQNVFTAPNGMTTTQGIIGVRMGGATTCFLFETSQLACFGYNANGVYGNGDLVARAQGVILAYLSLGPSIENGALGSDASCVILVNRTAAYCAGSNRYNNIVLGPSINYPAPQLYFSFPSTFAPSRSPTMSPSLAPSNELTSPHLRFVGYEDTPLNIPLSLFVLRPSHTVFRLFSVPSYGELLFQNESVAPGMLIPASETLVYIPDPNTFSSNSPSIFVRHDLFQISTSINNTESSQPGSAQISIVAQNDAPSHITPNQTLIYSTSNALVFFTIFDIDLSYQYTARIVEYSQHLFTLIYPDCNGVIYPPGSNIYVDSTSFPLCVQSLIDSTDTGYIWIEISEGFDGGGLNSTLQMVQVDIEFSFSVCATPCSVTIEEDSGSITLEIPYTDHLNRPIQPFFEVIQPPQKGTLLPGFIYTPIPNQYGLDTFTFRAKLGDLIGPLSTYSIEINSVMDPSVLIFESVKRVCDDVYTPLQLGFIDIDNDQYLIGVKLEIESQVLGGAFYLPSNPQITFARCVGLSEASICSSMWIIGTPTALNGVLLELAFKCTNPKMVSNQNKMNIAVYKMESTIDDFEFTFDSFQFTRTITFTTAIQSVGISQNILTLASWTVIGIVSASLAFVCFGATCCVFACSRLSILNYNVDRFLAKHETQF